ncbi:sugar phosphate isomerase/epimerase family protein [Nonomuraea lactucae]|uniref:sugar phosphate isomerase/epimerase family protein n=1 Tax=Nonomuraea lactucae TaxID=2249762 RepID=UPI0013B47727|nr:sugar phosphate isomerase/epimerase [Nonomuraea lactucae]
MDTETHVIAAYGTLAGPVELGGREWSTFDWADRCGRAAEAGLRGLGIWHADLEHLLERRKPKEIRRIFDDHGLDHLELEFLTDWFLDGDEEARRRKDLLFEAAAELGARHIKVGDMFGRSCPPARMGERFAGLCAEAADRHGALLVYEPMPFGAGAAPLDDALEVVGAARTGNGGLALDTWHLARLGVTPDELRRVPPHLLAYVELSDGTAGNGDDLLLEAATRRRFPGEGDFDVAGYVRAAREIGYDGPWGVEVLSADLRDTPLRDMARRAYGSAAAVLARPEARP